MAKTTERDDRGAEYSVETGYGTIAKVGDRGAKGKNVHLELADEQLRFPVKGWLDTSNPALNEPFEASKDGTARITYRIETHRDRDLDPAIPIEEVDKLKKFRRFVILSIAAGSAAAPSAAATPSPPQPTEPTSDRSVPNEAPAAPPPPATGGTKADTWAYAAAVGSVDLAYEVLHEAAQAGELDQVRPEQVKALATILLRVADQAQVVVNGGTVDRNANSHTRARGAVRSGLQFFPPPSGADGATIGVWVTRLGRIAGALLAQASELANETPPLEDAIAVLEASWYQEAEVPPGWTALNVDQQTEVTEWAAANGLALGSEPVAQRVESYRRGQRVPA